MLGRGSGSTRGRRAAGGCLGEGNTAPPWRREAGEAEDHPWGWVWWGWEWPWAV